MIYWQLFLSFLQIGAFSFGGGYAALPLIQAQAIERYGWLSQTDFADLVTIAEMTPGPIAINAATFVGNLKSLRPAVVAMIFTAGLKILIPAVFPNGFSNLGVSDVNIRAGTFFLAGLVLLRKFKLSPIKVMLGCGVAELAVRTVLLLL